MPLYIDLDPHPALRIPWHPRLDRGTEITQPFPNSPLSFIGIAIPTSHRGFVRPVQEHDDYGTHRDQNKEQEANVEDNDPDVGITGKQVAYQREPGSDETDKNEYWSEERNPNA